MDSWPSQVIWKSIYSPRSSHRKSSCFYRRRLLHTLLTPRTLVRSAQYLTEIICGCTKNKAVCEALLIQREILVGGNDPIFRDLSFNEWYKLDHVMAALFGFNTSWLLYPQIMKAGLQAAADSI
jgi:hypothetical protein